MTGDQDASRLIDAGNACEDAGRLAEALDFYERAVRLAPAVARAHLNLGNAQLALGHADAAVETYERALVIDRSYAPAYFNMGNALLRLERRAAAVDAYRQAISFRPDFADAHVALGTVQEDGGQWEDAVASYRRALATNPEYAGAFCNLGNTLKKLGRSEEALCAYQEAQVLMPGFADAHYNSGILLHGLGRVDEAIASYTRTIELDSDHPGAHHMLGDALALVGRQEEAVASFNEAINQNPSNSVALCSLGNALRDLHRLTDAVAKYRRSLSINPAYVAAHCNLGSTLLDMGDVKGAIDSYRRAIEIDPDSAISHYNTGNALRSLGQHEKAIDSYQRAVAIDPAFALAHYNLGNAYKDRARPAEAVDCYRRALAISPQHVEAQNNLGNALQDLGLHEDAIAAYRKTLAMNPDLPLTASNLLFCLSHMDSVGPDVLFQEHRQFAVKFEQPLRGAWPCHKNDRDRSRRLEIGFVSGDLREHAVAFFIEPLLSHLATFGSLSLRAYANHVGDDSVSKRLRRHFAHWHEVAAMSDGELAEKILGDGVDILIDLSGHTGKSRLRTFARKPAPLQASWMGYPGTTGLDAMDYYFADRHFLPPGEFDDQFTEKLVYLPASAPFLPANEAPGVNVLPAMGNGYITFGSFNRLSKLSSSTIALWSKLLRALPESRMVVGGMPGAFEYDSLSDGFAREGIARQRLEFLQRCGMQPYLALHHRIDICLDTVPYTGGTTTSHALWMGVPTLTLAGRTVAGRQGAAILGSVGLEAFIATDVADFERKGLHWAGNIEELAALRAGLRQRYELSPIRDPARIASGLERGLRMMWLRYCANLPPERIDASR